MGKDMKAGKIIPIKTDHAAEFERAKQIEITKLECAMATIFNPSSAFNLRKQYEDFHGKKPSCTETTIMLDHLGNLYAEMGLRIQAVTYSQFKSNPAMDIFEGMFNSDVRGMSDGDMFMQCLSFQHVSPFAQNMLRIGHAIHSEEPSEAKLN